MKKSTKTAIEVGAGVLTAAALVAAGAYILSDKKRTAKAKAWVLKARKEVAKNIKAAKRLGESEYAHIVDRATKRIGSLHKVTRPELVKVAQELKAEWKHIHSAAKRAGKRTAAAPKRKKARR
jgi:hypothetical protein